MAEEVLDEVGPHHLKIMHIMGKKQKEQMPYGLNKKRPAKKIKWKNMVYKK